MAGDGDWSSLPADLPDLVSSHLALEHDLLHVRHVCAHWRASVTSRPAAPFRPWVVASHTRPFRQGPIGEYSLWFPRGVRRVDVSGPPPLPYCCGAPRGWLALADDMKSPTRLVLWEPRTGTEIALPPVPGVVQVFLSGDPLASPSGWMAALTQLTDAVDYNIFFWRPGDGPWSAAPEAHFFLRIHSVAFHGGKMYCIDFLQRIAVYDLSLVGTAASPPVLLLMNDPPRPRAAHFVTCDGDLLLVMMFQNRHSICTEVYRMGPDMLTPGRQQLDLYESERVTDLGGYSLFLGRGDAFALSAEEHPAIRRNCIYYVVHYGSWLKERVWAFMFDLESNVLEEIPFPPEHKENPEKQWWRCSWFCPEKPIFFKQY